MSKLDWDVQERSKRIECIGRVMNDTDCNRWGRMYMSEREGEGEERECRASGAARAFRRWRCVLQTVETEIVLIDRLRRCEWQSEWRSARSQLSALWLCAVCVCAGSEGAEPVGRSGSASAECAERVLPVPRPVGGGRSQRVGHDEDGQRRRDVQKAHVQRRAEDELSPHPTGGGPLQELHRLPTVHHVLNTQHIFYSNRITLMQTTNYMPSHNTTISQP